MDSSDVELPPPLPTTPTKTTPRVRLPFGRVTNRKRPFINTHAPVVGVDSDELAAAFNTSSDPAVFSSEETPDLENYSGSKRRKKKVYSGTWWGRLRSGDKESVCGDRRDGADRGGGGPKKKKPFRRNFDSGIFMDESGGSSSGPEFGSDPIEFLKSSGSSGDDLAGQLCAAMAEREGGKDVPAMRKEGFRRAPSRIVIEKSASDLRVESVVQKCLDDCVADVDLTNMDLKSLPSTINDLKTLVKPGSSASYAKLAPHLRLYLGNNTFSSFPSAILDLDKLRLLSIRQNHLSQIPPAIQNLTKLEELNLSGNKLEYLPYEILSLMTKDIPTKILLDPNPWRPLPSVREQLHGHPFIYAEHNTQSIRLNRIAISPAVEYNPIGLTIPSTSTTTKSQSQPQQRSPHLTELLLRTLKSQSSESARALSQSYSHLLTPNVKALLDELHHVQAGDAKGRKCTFCKRDVVLPRCRWIEWWRIGIGEGVEDRKDEEVEVDGDGDGDKRREMKRKKGYVFLSELPMFDESAVEPLPFVRVSCGCSSQIEGLECEMKTLGS